MKAIALAVVTAAFVAGPAKETPVASRAATTITSVFVNGYASQDPADSVYRLAREAFTKGDFSRSAELFERVVERYPSSTYAGDAMYFLAFSNYRIGGTERLRSARETLSRLQATHPNVAKGDAATLRTRICGELAKLGDEACAAEVTATARSLSSRDAARDAARASARSSRASSSNSRTSTAGCPDEDDDDD
jgi:TolA-binding protein